MAKATPAATRRQPASRREPAAPDGDLTYEPGDEKLDTSEIIVDVGEARRPRSERAKEIASHAEGAALVDRLKVRRSPGAIHDINPYDLWLQPGWNYRNFENPRRKLALAKLASSIAAIGVQEPLIAHVDNDLDRIVVHSGWNRLLATYHAIEFHDADLRGIPVRFGRAGQNEADRILSQIVNNDGDPLTPYEQGQVFKALVNYGWPINEIARKVGKSASNVKTLLDLQALPIAIQDLVHNGIVSAYYATKEYHTQGENSEKTLDALRRAIDRARAEGATRVMPKHSIPAEERERSRRGGGGSRRRIIIDHQSPPVSPIEPKIPLLVEALRSATLVHDDEGWGLRWTDEEIYRNVVVLAGLVDQSDIIEDAEEPEEVPDEPMSAE